jgi:hypothetical protein
MRYVNTLYSLSLKYFSFAPATLPKLNFQSSLNDIVLCDSLFIVITISLLSLAIVSANVIIPEEVVITTVAITKLNILLNSCL